MKIGKTFLLASALTLVSLPSTATAQDHAEPNTAKDISAEGNAAPEADIAVEADPSKKIVDGLKGNIKESTALLRKLYGVDKRPAIDESRLPDARHLATAVISEASIRDVFANTYGGMIQFFGSMVTRMDSSQLVSAFGLPIEQADEVNDEQLVAISLIIDPQQKLREERIKQLAKPFADGALEVLVPAWQAGSAKAAARHYDAAQLAEIRSFLSSDAGRNFATKFLAWQTDPENTLGLVEALPDLIDRLEPMTKDLPKQIDSLPPFRGANDLTNADLRKIAKILKVDYGKIKAHRDQEAAALKAAVAEADAAAEDPLNQPITEIEAYDRDQWTEDHLAKVEALEQAVAEAQQALTNAETAAIKDAESRLKDVADSVASEAAH